jgi:hypothetical protein
VRGGAAEEVQSTFLERTPIPSLLEARRRLAGEVLAAAAVHSAITDELDAIELLRSERPLQPSEEDRCAVLRARKRDALRRHDLAEQRLRRLATHLRRYAQDASLPS